MDVCLICRQFSDAKLFSIDQTISDISIKNILYDLNFKFPFGDYMSSKICPDCCCNLIELYNFRDYCCGIFVEELNLNNCRICFIKTDEILMLMKSTIINGVLFKNAHILRQLCSYDFNMKSNNLCTECYQRLITHYIFHLKCMESLHFWTNHVLETANSFHPKTKSSKTECKICFKSFRDKYDLKVHLRVHTGEKPYKCEICAKSFTKSCNLSSHLKIHTGETKLYKCELCAKTCTRSTDLKRHLRLHTGEKRHQCKTCSKLFTRYDQLKYHILVVHSNEKPYKCELCAKSFTQSGSLKTHARIHSGEKPFKCGVCLESFRLKAILVEHMKKHTNEKPYMCEICAKSFAQSGTLKTHLKLHGCQNDT